MPHEWPFAFYEMSFLLPHFLEEGRGDVDVYFTRVYNPMWINPDGFMWLKALRDEEKIKCHVALTPTWNESAWFADYVLPMGHAGERHDLMSQETHAGQWIGFRQPVRRVALEKLGQPVERTYEANPGEVSEENELWIDLSVRMDPDGSPSAFVSTSRVPYRPRRGGHRRRVLPVDLRKLGARVAGGRDGRGAFAAGVHAQVRLLRGQKRELRAVREGRRHAADTTVDERGRVLPGGRQRGRVSWSTERRVKTGFETPSRRLELFSTTLAPVGMAGAVSTPCRGRSRATCTPSTSTAIKGEMLLLPNFRLPTLIHTRSANAKWLYEISHKNPVWMNP